MKNYSIKNYAGQKTLIVNDLNAVDVKDLFKKSIEMRIPFAIKQEIGIKVWGLSTVADFLGIKDSSKVLND